MASSHSRSQPARRRRPNRPAAAAPDLLAAESMTPLAAVPDGLAAESLTPLEPCDPCPDGVEARAAWAAARPELGPSVQVIVRVAEDDYVPPCVEVRARISSVLFTGQLDSGDLDRLRADPRVVSVGFGRTVRPATGD